MHLFLVFKHCFDAISIYAVRSKAAKNNCAKEIGLMLCLKHSAAEEKHSAFGNFAWLTFYIQNVEL